MTARSPTPTLDGSRRRWWRLATAFAFAVMASPTAQAVQEEHLKAAIVYNLLGFVDWPVAATPPAGAEFVLCVDPASPLAAPLRELSGRPVRGWRLLVRNVEAAQASRCQVLVADGPARDTPPGLRPAPADPVLVISDRPRPGGATAHVWLLLEGGKVAFELDLASARRSGIQISSRLLRLARAVHE